MSMGISLWSKRRRDSRARWQPSSRRPARPGSARRERARAAQPAKAAAASGFCAVSLVFRIVESDERLDLFGLAGAGKGKAASRTARGHSNVAPPSRTIRRASAWAASTYTGSFKVTNDWSGVLVRTRLIAQISRLGASNAAIEGYGTVRRQNV